jgi:hypothetical protein
MSPLISAQRIEFDRPEDVYSDPTRDLASRKLSKINGVMVWILHFSEPHSDLVARGWIAKLPD